MGVCQRCRWGLSLRALRVAAKTCGEAGSSAMRRVLGPVVARWAFNGEPGTPG